MEKCKYIHVFTFFFLKIREKNVEKSQVIFYNERQKVRNNL